MWIYRLTTRPLRGVLDMVTICTLLWSCCGCKHQVESERGEHLSRNRAGFVEVPKCDTGLGEISRFAPECRKSWPHFQKKVVEGHSYMECTHKSKTNDIDFKNKIFWSPSAQKVLSSICDSKRADGKGREVVKDIVGGGLQNLMAGEKNLLNESEGFKYGGRWNQCHCCSQWLFGDNLTTTLHDDGM